MDGEVLEDLDETMLEVDTTTGEVRRAESVTPDASLAKTIRGSVSLVKAYTQCPAQAYGRITRQKQTKTMALVNGIAVHEALEKNIKEGKDAQKEYESVLKYEAERNEVSLSGDAAEEAKKVGRECIGAAVAILDFQGKSPQPLRDRIDKDLVEAGFSIERNGRLYVGKIDFAVFKGDDFAVADWKTGKNAPSPYELSTDIQFTMYPYALFHEKRLKTYGKWAKQAIYIHLRGQSTEIGKDGRRVAKNRTKKPLQYDFPTTRTEEFVEYQFTTGIEPFMAAMEDGHFGRVEGKNCQNCGFFNKKANDGIGRCEVEIPADAILKKQQQLDLIDHKALTESKRATLKPYNE